MVAQRIKNWEDTPPGFYSSVVAWFSDSLKEAICFIRPMRCNNYVIVSIFLNQIISSAIPPFRN